MYVTYTSSLFTEELKHPDMQSRLYFYIIPVGSCNKACSETGYRELRIIAFPRAFGCHLFEFQQFVSYVYTLTNIWIIEGLLVASVK